MTRLMNERPEDTFFAPCPMCADDDPKGCWFCNGAGRIEVESPQLEMDERDDEDDPWHVYDRNDGSEGLAHRCAAGSVSCELSGMYVVGNTLWLAGNFLRGESA